MTLLDKLHSILISGIITTFCKTIPIINVCFVYYQKINRLKVEKVMTFIL